MTAMGRQTKEIFNSYMFSIKVPTGKACLIDGKE
jgi:hypothetical protein